MNLASLFAAITLAFTASAGAQAPAADRTAQNMPRGSAATPAAAPLAEGEVRKIDKEQGKVTLRHGPIAHLDMPGMTMVFKVTDAKMLDTIKEGDKVKFAADRINGAMTVTAIEAAK